MQVLGKHEANAPRVVKVFWACLEEALSNERSQSVEPLDPVVSRHVGDFLQLLMKRQFAWVSPVEHGAIALWAYLNWYAFAELVGTLKGKWPEGGRMNAWHLAKHGMLVIDRLAEAKKSSEDEKIKSFTRMSELNWTS